MRLLTAPWALTGVITLGLAAPLALAQQSIAPAAAAEGAGLEEVVITAQKRTEKLEDVTVSAQVISAQALVEADVADISDINKLVPSVQLNGTINGRVPTGIRGVSSVSNEGTVGISSGVAIAIDGVTVPSDSFAANNVAGIQSVEVLLGPQSTLGGSTAASGLINLTTRSPTDTLQGNATITGTNDGERRIDAFVSGPFSDRVEGSLSAYKSKTDYPIRNLNLGNYSSVDVTGARAKLLFKFTDQIDATLMAHYEDSTGDGMNFVYTYITPGTTILIGPGGPPFLSVSALLPGITPSLSNLNYASPVVSGASHRDNDYSLIINGHLPDDVTLTSTTAYQHESQHQIQDLFAVDAYFFDELTGGHAHFSNSQSQNNTVTTTSEELKLASAPDQTFSWLVGAYYSDVKIDEIYQRVGLTPATYNVIVQPDTKTTDVYARTTWKISDSNSLVTGLRYNQDKLSLYYDQLANAPYFSPIITAASDSSSAVVGDIAFKHQFAPNTMAYASYSRGYSPQAYNTSAVLTQPFNANCPPPGGVINCYAAGAAPVTVAPLQPVGQEHIDSYEIGTKGTYFNRTLTVNAALFDTIYTNYQIQSYSNTPGNINPPLELTAAGKAETKGLEFNTEWLATPLTRISLNLALINAKFVNYANAPCFPTQTLAQGCITPPNQSPAQDVSGATMPNSPKIKGVFGIEQRFPLANRPYEVVLGGTYTYRSSAQMLPDQNPQGVQGAFGLVNLSAAIRSTNGKYGLTLYMNNVTDHVYYTDLEDFWSGPWGANAVVGQPARDAHRYLGLRLSASL